MLRDGLVLDLPLQEKDGDAFMSNDVYGHRCTNHGSNWNMEGHTFDGIDDYITTPSFSITNVDNCLSISCWIYSATGVDRQTLLSDANQQAAQGYIWYTRRPGNTISMEYATGTTRGALNSTEFFNGYNNKWVHVLIVVDYANKWAKFYRNGTLISTETTTDIMLYPDTNNIKYIGTYSGDNRFYGGKIKNYKIYNRDLSLFPNEIYNLSKGI